MSKPKINNYITKGGKFLKNIEYSDNKGYSFKWSESKEDALLFEGIVAWSWKIETKGIIEEIN